MTDTPTERDPRWENVYASFEAPDENWVVFKIHVRLRGIHHCEVQRIHKEDLVNLVSSEWAPGELWKWIMDAMVDMMDHRLEGTR